MNKPMHPFSVANPGWLPLWLSLLCLSVYPIHFDFFYHILTHEDGIIESLTSVFSFAACFLALFTSASFYGRGHYKEFGVILLFALGCLFFAGEEISWGQRLFRVEVEKVSPLLAELNNQDEITLHNIPALQKMRLLIDVFCLILGVIIPFFYSKRPFPVVWLRAFLAPRWMIPAFVTTMLITLPKKIAEMFYEDDSQLMVFRMGELKEFCFGLVLLLYACHLFLEHYKKKTASPTTNSNPH